MAFADRSGAAVTVTITGGAHRENSRARWSQHPAHVSASLASQGVGTRTASTEDMGLFQSKRGDDKAPRSSAVLEGDGSDVLSPHMATDGHGGLIQPRKVPNPVRESQSHRELHRELLFSHSRGILPRHRAELPRVLESRRLRQLREELQGPPSDLEQQLRKRHQRLEEHEREAAAGPDPGPRPEFLLVRDSLRKMKLAEPGAWQM
ncbi:protein FAM107B-like [Accipiter gentilis]|uniref:protein FAM107B-like n=1 Tax=Astur gentilis TaxID=8957 RepID=UPI0021101B36|nr:protein FAM107B-like [Accipiter gentilis]